MKLYMHPVSMTSRPVRLFAADNKIAMDEEVYRPVDRRAYAAALLRASIRTAWCRCSRTATSS